MIRPGVEDNLRCIREGIEQLAALSDEAYTASPCTPIGSGLGAQFRHILDHYTCLLRGIRDGVVDYDDRQRQRLIEQDRRCARDAFAEVAEGLRTLTAADFARPLGIRLRAGASAEHLIGVQPTTLARELHFVMTHTVHHFALIAGELSARGAGCGDDFGVAPATRGHRRAQR